MQANLDKTVTILDENREAYHVEMESRAIDPRFPLDPIIRRMIKVFRPIDYKKYFQCSVDEQIGYLKTMGLRNARLVHDPSIEAIEKIVFPETAEEKKLKDDAIKKMNKMRIK